MTVFMRLANGELQLTKRTLRLFVVEMGKETNPYRKITFDEILNSPPTEQMNLASELIEKARNEIHQSKYAGQILDFRSMRAGDYSPIDRRKREPLGICPLCGQVGEAFEDPKYEVRHTAHVVKVGSGMIEYESVEFCDWRDKARRYAKNKDTGNLEVVEEFPDFIPRYPPPRPIEFYLRDNGVTDGRPLPPPNVRIR